MFESNYSYYGRNFCSIRSVHICYILFCSVLLTPRVYSLSDTAKLTGAYATVLNYKTDISVQKNSHLVLDCNIRASSATMRYTWFKDGQELLPQRRLYIAASNGSLIIEKVINKRRKGKSDEGFYECVGDNYIGGRPLGTVIGRRVNITIKSKCLSIYLGHDFFFGPTSCLDCSRVLTPIALVLNVAF